ncbi:MAG TPA: peptidoglycan-binding protein [Myxococcales bacterium]|nr:peptidoglycan-binding protein [Myxococcales bacterium]
MATAGAPPPGPGTLKDAALRNAFGDGAELFPPTDGSPQAVALEYALGRLGLLGRTGHGAFDGAAQEALASFQAAHALPATGKLNRATLDTLDSALAALPREVPAVRSGDPMKYLSDFDARGLSKVAVHDRSRPVDWSHPEIQAAYGKFVGEYWDVMKENRVETDCKTLALVFMDQFRGKVKRDLGVELPLPKSEEGRVPPLQWKAATAQKTLGYFSRVDALPHVRDGYAQARAIQKLDPDASLIPGVDLLAPEIDANMVGRAAKTVVPWDPARDNKGDRSRPEVPVDQLRPGDLIFIDHTGDGRWDHTINVVKAERDADGHVRKLVLAVGSFDDMKDSDGSTAPRGGFEINNYAEEVTVDLDASGKIVRSETTYTSEPQYLVKPRYSATNTLMELRPNGRIKVGRWGD